jgi:hypothetical protein
LLEDAICEMKPLAPTYRVLALRREGWTTGLTAALLAGAALFAYTWTPPGIGDGLVVTARKNSPPLQPKTTPNDQPGGLVAQSEKDDPISRPFQRAPMLDTTPLVDPDRFEEKKAPPPELPASLVQLVQRGAKYEDPSTQITFVCLDVKKMAGRLEIVLLKHAVGDQNVKTTSEDAGTIVSFQVNATPELMAKVLTELKDAEETSTERLIAEVLVSKPTTPVAQNEKRIKQNPPAANFRPSVVPESPTPPLGIDDPGKKIAAGAAPKESPAVEQPTAEQPRQYVLVFRRQEILPRSDSRKG